MCVQTVFISRGIRHDVVQESLVMCSSDRSMVDEMCFFFNFGTATNVWFDGLRGISFRAGVPCSSVPSKKPAVAQEPRQREASRRKYGTTMTRRTPRKGRLR